MEGPDFLTLPAGDSATVSLVDPNYGMPSVESDPVHGSLAFHARMVGDLVDNMPWDDIGEMNGITAKAVACAGSTLALFNSRHMAFDDALGTAETCVGMFNEISDQWAKRAAEAAPTAQALRSRIHSRRWLGAPSAWTMFGSITAVNAAATSS